MIDKNMVGIPLQTTTNKTANNVIKTISDVETKYPTSQSEADTKTGGLALPYKVLSRDLQSEDTMHTGVEYTKYDSINGNLLEYKIKGLTPVAIIWGYNNTQPIAKIEGAKYSDISTTLIDAIVTASDTDAGAALNNDESALLAALDSFRNNSTLSGFQITTYTYDPLIGVRSITPPSGVREYYFYDNANRLEYVKDVNGNILKEFKYNYKQ